ncbi:uncharacterized protein [Watersipora subatra]|uniref:uncharacterized protein n=1 Tax=Watersipora subatra TaxID=2589382 RepID=UPI00355C9A6C
MLVAVDYYSRFYEVAYLKNTTAEKTVLALDSMFFIHGLPKTVKSDNGPQFVSQVFQDYLKHNGIEHLRVTPRYPQANGEIERQNSSLMKRIKIAYGQNRDYKPEVQKYMTAYRSIPHPSTGKPPAELLYRRTIRTKMPRFKTYAGDQAVRDSDEEYKAKSKLYFDQKNSADFASIIPGDTVLMRREVQNKVDTPFQNTPVTVVEKNQNQVPVECPGGHMLKRNVTCFKPYVLLSDTIVGREETENQETGTSSLAKQTPLPDLVDETPLETEPTQEAPTTTKPRWTRERNTKPPGYLKDYVMGK